MPTYGFLCEKCDFKFEKILKICDRELPLNEECPSCKKKTICKDFSSLTPCLTSDSTMSPDKATGGRWSELMGRMKKGLSKKHHEKLEKTKTNTGRLWRG